MNAKIHARSEILSLAMTAKASTATNRDYLEQDEKYYIQCYGKRPEPVLVEGRGCLVKDVEGETYIDFTSGQMAVPIGHCHPDVVAAIKTQADKLMHTQRSFATVPQIELAEKLAKLAPGNLKKSYFLNTGGESVEYSLRLAKFYTGHYEFIAPQRSYFGLTAGVLSLTTVRPFRGGGAPLVPGAMHVPAPYTYRCPFRCDNKCNYACTDYIEDVIANESCGSLAAWVSEVILGAGGMIVPPDDYFRKIQKIAKSYAMLMIFDEAQTAFGRTGKMFAFEHYGVVPDILAVSKSLGGGVPLAASITTREIADSAVKNGFIHATTHAGDPLTCAAGSAALGVVVKEKLVDNARRMGEHMRKRLDEMKEKYDFIGDVRSKGMFAGVEFVKDRRTKEPSDEIGQKVIEYCTKHGLIISQIHLRGASSILRLVPPLVINGEIMGQALDILDGALHRALREDKS